MLFAKLRQHRNDQRPAAEFHPQVFEKVGVREFGKVYHLGPPTVWRILCHTHYVVHSSCCQEKSWETYPTETAPDWLEVHRGRKRDSTSDSTISDASSGGHTHGV